VNFIVETILFLWNIIFTFYYTRVRPQCDYSILGRICPHWCMWVCTYVCAGVYNIYVYIIHAYTYVHICMFIELCYPILVCISIYSWCLTSAYTHSCVCVYVPGAVCEYIYMNVLPSFLFMYTCVWINVYMCTHKYIF